MDALSELRAADDYQRLPCGCETGIVDDQFRIAPCALDCKYLNYVIEESARQRKPTLLIMSDSEKKTLSADELAAFYATVRPGAAAPDSRLAALTFREARRLFATIDALAARAQEAEARADERANDAASAESFLVAAERRLAEAEELLRSASDALESPSWVRRRNAFLGARDPEPSDQSIEDK